MKLFYLCIGLIFLFLAFLGVLVPVLPTTPFLILAAMCFSKSSEKLHYWLVNNKIFGKYLYDWENFHIIPIKAKWLASAMTILSCSYVVLQKNLGHTVNIILVLSIILLNLYIWRFPSSRGD